MNGMGPCFDESLFVKSASGRRKMDLRWPGSASGGFFLSVWGRENDCKASD